MIYTKQSQIYYLTAQPVSELYYDLYNFSTMTRIDNAYKDLMNSNFNLLGLQKTSPDKNDRYSLVLDFLANVKTDYLSSIVDQVNNYLTTEKFFPEISEEPLRLTVDNLKIEDVVNIIQDDKFQTLNTIVATTNSTVWKLHKK